MRRVSAFLRRHLLMTLVALVLLAVVVVWWLFPAPIAQGLGSVQARNAVAFLREHLFAVTILGSALVAFALLIWLPKWQATHAEQIPDAPFERENEARKTLAEIIGGVAILAGLFFTWETLKATQENLRITQETATKSQDLTREGQITERFSKAIDHLGAVNDKGEKQLEIRLGGIYALERIARDSERDHWPVMEVLTAYVRENAPWKPEPPKDPPPRQDDLFPIWDQLAAQGQSRPMLATDIQAILTVLGRRDRSHETEGQHLDLSRTDLHDANFFGGHLENANLSGARLEGAILRSAHLENADLSGARLENADLTDARLEEAAHLSFVQLCAAVTLYGATLDSLLREYILQECPRRLHFPRIKAEEGKGPRPVQRPR